MAIWPFIISRCKREELGEVVVNHERIHFRQQLEMLFFPFFIWYALEYLIRWLQLRNKNAAYLGIGFEKEAYSNETQMAYLKNRRPYGWLKYIRNAAEG